ncbi:MAG: CBS domain-containing protein [Bacillota bacterium]|nr:CBS domain-containing protein [Bacillota bacterium]MDW7683197.1 CBS domain-containing protein [Bacillota bacterium]
MQAKEIMITNLSLVHKDASMKQVAQTMLEKDTSHVIVTDDMGKIMGLVAGTNLRLAVAEGDPDCTAARIMVPRDKLFVAYPDTPVEEVADILTDRRVTQLPVVEHDIPVGYLNLSEVLQYTSEKAKETANQLDQFRQAALLIEAMQEGLVVVDRDYCIREFNRTAQESSGIKAEQILGKQSRIYMEYQSPVRQVMESGQPLLNFEVQNNKGQVFMTNNVPIMMDGDIAGVMQTFAEITEMKQMHHQLLKTKDELDKAFALTLPNSRVEQKLKHTPEYRDIFNPVTGQIEVTEVIEDGGYHHVVNALKVAADLNEKGLMGLLGVDKDILVQALIFHDVGKSQPVLNVGQLVDPKKVFEPSTMHAMRSADIVMNYYNKPVDVVTLIRYHHHQEDELPDDFPSHLLPMFRLIRIIDGLSAGLTRRNARIGFRVSSSRLTVLEHNGHPNFNRTMEVDLYTGQEFVYTEKKINAAKREALKN